MTGSIEFTFPYFPAKELIILLLLAVPHSSHAGDAQLQSSPGAIFSEREGPGPNLPLWISVKELTVRGERFETTNLLDSGRSFIALSKEDELKRRKSSLPDSFCPVSIGYALFERLDGRSVENLQLATESSLAVLTGRIAYTAPGFMLGLPNTLLTLDDISIFSNRGQLALTGPLYLPIHRANFSFDGFSFCAQALYSQKMYTPSIGDQVMIFLLDPPVQSLLLAHPDQLVILPQNSTQPLLPPHLFADPSISQEITQTELLSAIQTMANQR